MLLEQLERANLFLIPLDGARAVGLWSARKVVSYHALFAEAMQHEARRRLGHRAATGVVTPGESLVRTARMAHGLNRGRLAAQDFPYTADLIERIELRSSSRMSITRCDAGSSACPRRCSMPIHRSV